MKITKKQLQELLKKKNIYDEKHLKRLELEWKEFKRYQILTHTDLVEEIEKGKKPDKRILIWYLLGYIEKDPINEAPETLVIPGKSPDIDCLHELTPVVMFDGSYKLLRDIKIGDVVLDANGGPGEVINYAIRTARSGYEKIVELVVKNDQELGSFICPGHHKMISPGHTVKYVYELNIGDKIKSFGNNNFAQIIAINDVDIDYDKINLVDIQVLPSATFQILPFKVEVFGEYITCTNNILKSITTPKSISKVNGNRFGSYIYEQTFKFLSASTTKQDGQKRN